MARLRPVIGALLLGGGLFGLYWIGREAAASSLFTVKELRWRGLDHLSEPEMTRRFQSAMGENLFRIDVDRLRKELLTNSWIKKATVRKDFPDRLTFIIEERTPASVEYRIEEDLFKTKGLLDREGVPLGEGGDYPELPRFLHVNPGAYPKALRLAELLTDRSDFFIDLSKPDDLAVYLPDGVLRFGEGNYSEKWNRFVQVEEDLKRRRLSDWEVDLRFSGKVIVKSARIVPPVGSIPKGGAIVKPTAGPRREDGRAGRI